MVKGAIIMIEDFDWLAWLANFAEVLYMVIAFLIIPFLPNR